MDGQVNRERFNSVLTKMDIYASKAISLRAKANPQIANLSFGEPEFGPPEHALEGIGQEDLSAAAFMDACKRYEEPRGNPQLRAAISAWYQQRYQLSVDPDTEIMVTHGGVEAITLALLVVTEIGDRVAISDPSYMLYARTIKTLGRQPTPIIRPAGGDEYAEVLARPGKDAARAIIINSPENPTGYVLSPTDWESVARRSAADGTWVIHDEVYDVMAFERRHTPAISWRSLSPNAILVNSFSKKFGLPGLRIGWMVAPPAVIELAAKAHDYLYLGVNIQYERIARRLLSDPRRDAWLEATTAELRRRSLQALSLLDEGHGYTWARKPLGAMFAFPGIGGLYQTLPAAFRSQGAPQSDAVARYLLEERLVAVVPGSVYGRAGAEHVRLVLCTPRDILEKALARMRG